RGRADQPPVRCRAGEEPAWWHGLTGCLLLFQQTHSAWGVAFLRQDPQPRPLVCLIIPGRRFCEVFAFRLRWYYTNPRTRGHPPRKIGLAFTKRSPLGHSARVRCGGSWNLSEG